MKKDKDLKKALDSVQESLIDFAESQLKKLMTGVILPETKVFNASGKLLTYNVEKHYVPDNTSIIFYLKTKGKGRGYIEKTEHDANLNITNEIPFNIPINKNESK